MASTVPTTVTQPYGDQIRTVLFCPKTHGVLSVKAPRGHASAGHAAAVKLFDERGCQQCAGGPCLSTEQLMSDQALPPKRPC
jgi:hypothetical protein